MSVHLDAKIPYMYEQVCATDTDSMETIKIVSVCECLSALTTKQFHLTYSNRFCYALQATTIAIIITFLHFAKIHVSNDLSTATSILLFLIFVSISFNTKPYRLFFNFPPQFSITIEIYGWHRRYRRSIILLSVFIFQFLFRIPFFNKTLCVCVLTKHFEHFSFFSIFFCNCL